MSDEVESLMQSVLDAANSLIAKSTVAILVARPGQQVLQSDSTGVLVQISNSRFVFTVAHSVSDYVDNKISVFALGGMPSSRVVSLANSEVRKFGTGKQLDAAVLRIAPEQAAELGKTMTFLRLDQMEVDHSLSTQHCYLVTGFPGSEFELDYSTGKVQMDTLRYITTPYLGQTIGLKDFDPRVAYAFDYNQNDAVGMDGGSVYMPTPYGMSGGGIWTLGNKNSYSNFKAEDIRLVAVEFGFYERWGPILGTKLGVVLSLIYRTYPELRSSIDLHPRICWPNCPGMFV